MKKIFAIFLAFFTLFTCTVVTASASVSDALDNLSDDFKDLGNAYCDYFNDLASADFLGMTLSLIDIPLALFDTIEGVGAVLYAGSKDLYYFLVGDDLYLQDNRGGGGGRVCVGRGGGGGRTRDNLHASGDLFSKYAQMYNDHYNPKNTKEYVSWRTDPFYSDKDNGNFMMTFFSEGYFFSVHDWHEVYLVDWYTDGTNDYFGKYQYHFYYEHVTDEETSETSIILYLDIVNMLDGTVYDPLVFCSDLSTIRYIDLGLPVYSNRINYFPFPDYTYYIHKYGSPKAFSFPFSDRHIFYSIEDKTPVDVIPYTLCWRGTVSSHDSGTCEYGSSHDIGFYCSDEPISMSFGNIDWTKFTKEDTVTLNGDTIYDYTITNNNGDSSTINEYITNNYTYITNNNGGSDGSSSGSGSVSGDVNVSGNIDVSGSVDVNITVDQGSSGASDLVSSIDDYVNYLPEVAPGVTEYLEITYSFLPVEIVGLLIGGVAAAIICRVLGR